MEKGIGENMDVNQLSDVPTHSDIITWLLWLIGVLGASSAAGLRWIIGRTEKQVNDALSEHKTTLATHGAKITALEAGMLPRHEFREVVTSIEAKMDKNFDKTYDRLTDILNKLGNIS